MPKPIYTAQAGHPQRRKADEPLVNAGGAVCGLCGRPILPGKVRLRPTAANPMGRLVSSWHWDHTTGGPAHISCNTREGGIRGNKSVKRRRVRRVVVRTWGAW